VLTVLEYKTEHN